MKMNKYVEAIINLTKQIENEEASLYEKHKELLKSKDRLIGLKQKRDELKHKEAIKTYKLASDTVEAFECIKTTTTQDISMFLGENPEISIAEKANGGFTVKGHFITKDISVGDFCIKGNRGFYIMSNKLFKVMFVET